jgi:hypothetical protein
MTNYNTPMTDADSSALAVALSNPSNTNAAKVAALKAIATICAQQAQFGFEIHEVFDAMSEGFDGMGESALCEALSWETRILGSWGGIIVQAAGVIQIFSWIKEVTTWFFSTLASIESLFVGMMGKLVGTAVGGLGGAITSPLASVLNLLGGSSSSTTTKANDSKFIRRDASNVLQGLLILAASEAPTFTAVVNTLGMTSGTAKSGGAMGAGAGTGTGSGTGTGTGSGTGTSPTGLAASTPKGSGTGSGAGTSTGQNATGLAASSPQNTGTGTGTGTATADKRRPRDGRALGQNTRRSLVNRASRG